MPGTYSVPSTRARRRLIVLVLSVLAVALLASCSNTPTAYSNGIRKDFVKGCTTNKTPDGSVLSSSVCGCVYDKLHKNVDFKDFKKLQDDLRDKKKPLGDLGPTGKKAVSYLSTCESSASS